LQETPKFTHIAIFGLKIYHLALLVNNILYVGATQQTSMYLKRE
jgi:hypothetical protein